MADFKISGATAGTSVSPTDEFVINQTATPGVSGATKRVTGAMVGDMVRRTAIGNAAYTILSSDRLVVTSVAFTAPRTWTLPAANSLPASTNLLIIDEQRTITATNTLTIARAGSDTIEGGTASIVLSSAGASVRLMTDGTSKWTILAQKRSVNTITFTAGGTYTPSIGARSTFFQVQAGGASGGSSAGSASNSGAGSGGGAGAYAEKLIDLYLVSTAFTIVVGAGGNAPAAGNNVGNAGGLSSVAATGMTTVSAPGGSAGAGSGAAGTTVTNTAGGAETAAPTGGDLNVPGAAGFPGIRQSGTVAIGGAGGTSHFGGGGRSPGVATGGGGAAGVFGAGGAGATSIGNTNSAGGAGKAGLVLVTEFF